MTPTKECLEGLPGVVTIEVAHQKTDVEPQIQKDAIRDFATMAAMVLTGIAEKVRQNGRTDPRLLGFTFDQFPESPFTMNPIVVCDHKPARDEFYLCSMTEMRRLTIGGKMTAFGLGENARQITFTERPMEGIGADPVGGPGYFEIGKDVPLFADAESLKKSLEVRMVELLAGKGYVQSAALLAKMTQGLVDGSREHSSQESS